MNEYQEDKAKADNFLDFCKTPELAAKVTLDAQRILNVDAAILFSDLPLILEPLGLDLDYPTGIGPYISNPIRSDKDIQNLKSFSVEDSLGFVGKSIQIICDGLPEGIPLIGFSGAPFTLASYAIEGKGSKNYENVKKLMYGDAKSWHMLMEKLSQDVIEYLNYQIKCGVHAVQLFDSWIGALSPRDFESFVLPHTQKIISAVKGKVPVIFFGTGAGTFMDSLAKAGADVLGFDWRTPIQPLWDKLGCTGVQGNLDPTALFGNWDYIKQETDAILKSTKGKPGHIFNLGHGILPGTPVENVKRLAEYVQSQPC